MWLDDARCAKLAASASGGGIDTTRNEYAQPAPDLVQRRFQAAAPNKPGVADITYVPTWAGFLFLAVVLDGPEPSHRGRDGDAP